MVDSMQKVRFHPIPPEILGPISNELFWYSIGLVELERGKNGEEAGILGSGTLVGINGVFGILTAYHVALKIKKAEEVGLIVSSQIHKYSIKSKYLRVVDIAIPFEPSVGPDLSIVIIPNNLLGTLKALKSFFNISLKREEAISNPLELDVGVWVLFGFIGQKTVTEGPASGYTTIKGFYGQFGFTGIRNYYEQKGHDFLEVVADRKFDKTLPTTFGGTSGGGLWQVHLTQLNEGGYKIEKRALMGVAFYEILIGNDIIHIRCNGPRSIYEIAPKIVN